MFFPTRLEDFQIFRLYSQLCLSDVEEFRVAGVQVGDDVRPAFSVKDGVAFADFSYNQPGLSLYRRQRGVGVHCVHWGQLEAQRTKVVIPAMINVGMSV
jgi:hypothetical protein